LSPPILPDSKSTVNIGISTDASPQPHLGDPITLSNTKVTVKVPGDLLVQGYNLGILTNGQSIPSTLSLTIAGSNTTEGTHVYPTIHSSPTITIHDPDHAPNTGDETADPLTLTNSLGDTVWHPADPTKDVIFSQKATVITATIDLGGTPLVSTQTCKPAKVNPFIAVGANSVATTTTIPTSVSTAGVTTPTTVAVAATTNTLPRTGANVAFWLIVGAVLLDAGIVLIVGTRRRATQLLQRRS
jgi:hypothetical protein